MQRPALKIQLYAKNLCQLTKALYAVTSLHATLINCVYADGL
jgi:hypothetical protein